MLSFLNIRRVIFFLLLSSLLSCSTETGAIYQLKVTTEPEEAGSVEQSALETQEGESIQIKAIANEFWVFTGWAGDLTGTDQSTVYIHMDQDRHIIALFEKVEFPLKLNIEGEGNVQQEVITQKTISIDYPHESVVRLTAEPEYGWKFTHWSGDIESEEVEIDIEISGPVEVTATFERMDFKVSVKVEGEGHVEQEVIQAKVSETEYPFETMVQLTAMPDYGWEFKRWDGDMEGDDPVIVVNITEERSLTAIFERVNFKLTKTISGDGQIQIKVNGSLTSELEFPFETELELSATPEETWSFSGWSGDVAGNNPNITLVMDSDKQIDALFELKQYSVSIQIFGNGTVRQNGVQTTFTQQPHGSTVELQAIAAEGWVFAGWSGGLNSSFTPASITITGDTNINLHFAQLPSILRILPLGDSITNGYPYSYRYSLFHKLTAYGLSFSYIGSQNSNPANYPGTWDTRHEGHDGASSKGIDIVLESQLANYSPDIVLIHLGTNDVFYSINNSSEFEFTIEYMNSIIDKLRTKNPYVRIYLAKILPFGEDAASPIETYRQRRAEWLDMVQNLAATKGNSVSPIYIVDMVSGFDNSDLLDGIHPNEAAAEKMAQRWYNALTGN